MMVERMTMNTRGEQQGFLPLQEGILYGPVASRRYGLSLGINLLPCDHKLCSFNCVYCQYGAAGPHVVDDSTYSSALPGVRDVIDALKGALRGPTRFDLITFSGNGEPTLHPEFAEIVEATIKLRDAHRPTASIALLSNSSGLARDTVRRCVSRIDLPVLKLDAAESQTFRAVNRPARGLVLDDIVAELESLDRFWVQTVLLDGNPSNTGHDELETYFRLLARLGPQEVHIYSIDRPVPNRQIRVVDISRLKQIARYGRRQSGVPIRAFFGSGVGVLDKKDTASASQGRETDET
jgi:wyosine [tRNA(Phe)-imidazoG37] synthetase (radical SAM superfamily)